MKKFDAQTRITELERSLQTALDRLEVAADQTPEVMSRQITRWAVTIDDGDQPAYPPDPGDQSNTEPYVLPVVFIDASFDKTPGQQYAVRDPLSAKRMDYVHCTKWLKPDTPIECFHQDRRWWQISGDEADESKNTFVGWAFGEIMETMDCTATPHVNVRNLVYCKFGPFQIEWNTSPESGEMEWASPGDTIDWVENDAPIQWVGEGDDVIRVANPLGLCGAYDSQEDTGDIVLLMYCEPEPIIAEIVHKCVTVERMVWDATACELKAEPWEICITTHESNFDAQNARVVMDFDEQTLIKDVGYDASECSLFAVYEDFCVMSSSTPNTQVLNYLDLRDIQEPCCPCPDCPTDCSSCSDPLNVQINGWSSGDCSCLNESSLDLFEVNCSWDGGRNGECLPDNNESLAVSVFCQGGRWKIRIDYTTAGNTKTIYVWTEVDLGPADNNTQCPPTGTFPIPGWTYTGATPDRCITDADEVVIT